MLKWWLVGCGLMLGALNACQCPDNRTCDPACADGQTCEDGVCTGGASTDGGTGSSSGMVASSSSTGGTDGGSCGVCVAPRVCRFGTCLDEPPDCTDDTGCQDDARCVDGECLPYGVGGETNPSCTQLVALGIFTPAIQCEWQPPSSGAACTNPCNDGEWCMPDENLMGSYCTGQNSGADTSRPCTNPCTLPREVCMRDQAGALSCQDPFRQLLTTVTVVDFDLDDNPNTLHPSLVFSSYGFLDGSTPSGSKHGVVRIVDGETCQTLHSIDGIDPASGLPMRVAGSSAAALGDINLDGRADIISHAQGGGIWAFTWDPPTQSFKALWRGRNADMSVSTVSADESRWNGPAIHDLDDDGVPEILAEGVIYNAQGVALGSSQQGAIRFAGTGQIPVVADVDLSGDMELITGDQQYDFVGGDWVPHAMSPMALGNDGLVAIGDFGAFNVGGSADPGYPEIVVVGGAVRVRTLDGTDVFPSIPVPPAAVIRADGSLALGTGGLGGPPTVGDFDGDGRAEFAEAGGRAYTVFDFDCLGTNAACSSNADCNAMEHCPVAGRCSKSSTRCSTNSECPSGEDCFVLYAPSGHCSVTTGTACTDASQCPGETCVPDGAAPRHCVPMQCEGHGILWTQVSQDLSSNRTASSIFDFEADGRVEAVYSDECYTRVYDGRSGNVLFSQMHTSCTWYENPIIADVDGDLRSEIVIGSNENCGVAGSCFNNAFTASLGADGMPSNDDVRVDPIFAGLRCTDAADCPGASPNCVEGLCRCVEDGQCGGGDFACAPPIAGTTADPRNVCRAVFRPDVLDGRPGLTGVRVYRDQGDRWVGSRPIWNQHAYAVTHVGDRGEIPRTSMVAKNWATQGLNNFRQNVQGSLSGTQAPDITSRRATQGECTPSGDGFSVEVQARVCNRGTAPLGAGVPVTFYREALLPANVACTVTTTMQLAPGACEQLACTYVNIPANTPVQVYVRADDDGTGAGIRSECVEGNNTASLGAVQCSIEG